MLPKDGYMCFAIYDSELRDEMFVLLDLANIRNYTQFIGLRGSSSEGKKEGTVAWPGSNEILLIFMSESEKAQFKTEVARFRNEREKAPGLITLVWPIPEVF